MSYQAVAAYPGLAKGRSGAVSPLREGRDYLPVEIVLTPGSALAGRVSDSRGRSVPGAHLRARQSAGAPRFRKDGVR